MANYGGNSADITPYLFEAAEYDNLTSYKGSYPYAKEWALRYAQGDNKITGLCLKAETCQRMGVEIRPRRQQDNRLMSKSRNNN